MTYTTFLIVHLIYYTAANFAFLPKPNQDVFSQSTDVVEAILKNSGRVHCSVTYITDSSATASSYYVMSQRSKAPLGVGVFEVPPLYHINSTISPDSAVLFQKIVYHLKNSTRCMTVLLIGDQRIFQSLFIEWVYSKNVLLWQSRLLIVTTLPGTEFRHLKKTLSMMNSMLVVLENQTSMKRYGIYIFIPYSHRLAKIATWTSKTGILYVGSHRLFPNKFHRFDDGANLTVVAEDFPPHVRVIEFPQAGDGEPPHIHVGPLVQFLQLLSKDINFNYTLIRPPDRAWGYLPPNGSWIGMVGMVFRHEADFALGPFGITHDRAHAVEYTWPLVGDAVRISARKGKTEVDPWAFIMPLSPMVWAGLFASLAVLTIMHVLLSIPDVDICPNKRTWINYVLVFLQQDTGRLKDIGNFERFILATWILALLVVLESYSGNLTSLLAVRYVPQPYQSLRAVLDDPKAIMVWEGGTAYVGYFMSAQSGVFKDVAESRKHGRIIYIKATEYTEVLETLVMDGRHVLVIEDLALKMLFGEQFTKTGVCNYYLSEETFIHFIYGLVAQKYSPLALSISERVIGITHSGIYAHWMKAAVPNTTVCLIAPKKVAIQSSISLSNSWGMFVILGSGLITSLLVLVIEIASSRIFHSPVSLLEF